MNLSIFFKRSTYSHRFVACFGASVLCPILFILQSQVELSHLPISVGSKPISSQFIKFSTIGYWPAAVDWMWIETLQIIGGKNYSSELLPHVVTFYEVATDLDPKFYELYEQAAVLFSFYFKSTPDSIHFLDKGIQHQSKEWTHPYTLHLLAAYLYSYDLKDWSKAKEYYLKAAEVPGAPKYLSQMKEWLSLEGSEKMLAKRVLNILISQTNDALLKAEYQERLKQYD